MDPPFTRRHGWHGEEVRGAARHGPVHLAAVSPFCTTVCVLRPELGSHEGFLMKRAVLYRSFGLFLHDRCRPRLS